MSRAVFLPSAGDPFLLSLWYETWKKWRHIVNRLYVYYNGPVEKEVVDYVHNLYNQDNIEFVYPDNERMKFVYVKDSTMHGEALKALTQLATEEIILFMEDDGYILKPEYAENVFKQIESGEYGLAGSPRGSCSANIWNKASKFYNLDYSGYGDKGPNFWPNFFFCRRSNLLKTDLHFWAKHWEKGEYIEELDLAVDEHTVGDTFVWGSMQLRYIMKTENRKILEIPQYHAHPYWESDLREKQNIFDGICPWVHCGSLGGGMYGILTTDQGIPLSERKKDRKSPQAGDKLPEYAKTEAEKREWENRCAVYELSYYLFKDQAKAIEDFGKEYIKGVERIKRQYGLDNGRIYALENQYRKLFGL